MRIGITTDENNNLIRLEDSRYFVIFDDETKKEERYDSPAYKIMPKGQARDVGMDELLKYKPEMIVITSDSLCKCTYATSLLAKVRYILIDEKMNAKDIENRINEFKNKALDVLEPKLYNR